ncbi:MAG: hypothetical protein RR482_03605 [Clostridia bacterium]
MHPMLVVQAAPGLLYVNGRFCGEVGGGGLPLARDGVTYLEYRPLTAENRAQETAMRLNFRAGKLEDGLAPHAYAVQWPDGQLTLEVRDDAPEKEPPPQLRMQLETPTGMLLAVEQAGLAVGYDAGNAVRLPLSSLAQVQRFRMLRQALLPMCALEGRCGDEAFAAVLASDMPPRLLQCVQGCTVEVAEDGAIRTVEDAGDLVGHAILRVMAPDAQGNYATRKQENAWLRGKPRWPQTPAETARAWLEAVQRGNVAEAAGYAARPEQAEAWRQMAGSFDGVVALPYPLPGQAQVEWGVLSVVHAQLARVRAMGFTLVPQAHAQGNWRIVAVFAL